MLKSVTHWRCLSRIITPTCWENLKMIYLFFLFFQIGETLNSSLENSKGIVLACWELPNNLAGLTNMHTHSLPPWFQGSGPALSLQAAIKVLLAEILLNCRLDRGKFVFKLSDCWKSSLSGEYVSLSPDILWSVRWKWFTGPPHHSQFLAPQASLTWSLTSSRS